MLSSGMITHPFFIFPENFTHSVEYYSFRMGRRMCTWMRRNLAVFNTSDPPQAGKHPPSSLFSKNSSL
jgi:hypothetical protein